MKITITKYVLLIVVFCAFFVGCEDIVNGTVSLKVSNKTALPQTFTVSDSFSDKMLGTFTINNAVTETYTVTRGYYKSRPKNCIWQYDSVSDVWGIYEQKKTNMVATNELPLDVTLENSNVGITSFPVSIAKSSLINFLIYPDENNLWSLSGQQQDASGRFYIADPVNASAKIYFTIKITETSLLITLLQ